MQREESHKRRVEAYLQEHPEMAHSPRRVAQATAVPEGSAKRLLKEWRDKKQEGLQAILGPVCLQNVHYVGVRTHPDTVLTGSPPTDGPLALLGPWEDRGDGKLTAARDLPAQPGAKVEIRLSRSNPTMEVHIAAPKGLSPYEVLLILHLLDLPFDRDVPGTLSFEAFRDGSRARFEGVEARTYRGVEGWILKLYNHHDGRGAVARAEVRPPPVSISYREIEDFLMDKQPLGRDERIERLGDMARDNSLGLVELKKAVKALEDQLVREGRDRQRKRPRLGRGRPRGPGA